MQAALDEKLKARQEDVVTLEKLDINVNLKKTIKDEIKGVSKGLKANFENIDKSQNFYSASKSEKNRFNVLITKLKEDVANMRSKVAADFTFMLANNDGKIDEGLLNQLKVGLSTKRG